jgi:signal transduction histidine kinase
MTAEDHRARDQPRRGIVLSLKTKLALALAFAALLPLLIVVGVGARLTLGRLERGVRDQTRETARISLNLLLRRVQRLSDETARLAADPELHELVALEPDLVPRYLRTRAKLRSAGLVEVFLINRRAVGRASPEEGRFRALHSRPRSTALNRALNFERYLSVDKVGGRLVIQAAAPVVDAMFVLRGAVVTTLPLDDQMADYIRGVVHAEIGFIAGVTPVASTFVDQTGLRLSGVYPPANLVKQVQWGETALAVQTFAGREYAVAFVPLQTVKGRRIGMLSVGVSLEGLSRAKASAARSIFLGGLGGVIFALALAYVFGRRITIPLARLHRSTQAIAAGNLHLRIPAETDDEIGDLARAFSKMTDALREHEERLAARVREITTLHQIGRAVSSVLSLDAVLHLVVEEVTEVLGAERGALLLDQGDGALIPRAAVGLPDTVAGPQIPEGWEAMAQQVVERHAARVESGTRAVPLETRDHVVGALVVAHRSGGGGFSEGDMRLVTTFCDQAATAIDNARLYDEVRAFSEDLELVVERRTAELKATNAELQRTLTELKAAPYQLSHSEKMAALGTLVAGVAHEINTPAGAIKGSIQMLDETLQRLLERMRTFVASGLTPEETTAFIEGVLRARRLLHQAEQLAPTEVRRRQRELAVELQERGFSDCQRLSRRLVEARAVEMVDTIELIAPKVEPDLVAGLLEDLAFLNKSALSIQTCIGSIVRLVGTLKTYTHTDQACLVEAELTEGIETTLTILHNVLRYGIKISRNYGDLPRVPVYVDELNQVWTNLIQNSAQAMGGEGEIEIETFQEGEMVGVRITDNGPGIPEEHRSQIFDPFFTTKPRGEGTGLGLSIVQTIVEKHGGTISVDSARGETTFRVLLPLAGPPAERLGDHDAGD